MAPQAPPRSVGTRRLGRVRTLVADESGISLVLALMVVAVLSITTAALSGLVISNESAFSRDRQTERAFNVSEAGLNYGISQLTNFDPSGSKAINSTLGPVSYSIDSAGGTNNGTWTATKTAAGKWTITATGTSPNGRVNRRLQVQALGNTTTTNTPPSPAWGYGFFVASPTGCTNMVGTAQVTLPVWIQADLCLNGTQNIAEPNPSGPKKVTLYVGGKLTLTGNAAVGTSTRPIISATVVGGCVNKGAQICSNSSKSKVYADAYPTTPSTLTKPPVYPDAEYAAGDWNQPVCSTGSFTFDNNGTRNTSLGNVDILTGSSYNCTVYTDSSKTQIEGSLAWNAATKVLTINGTVYIDGNLVMAGGDQASYAGFGTIYVNGTVTTNGNSALCGPGATLAGSSCSGLWDANLGQLFIVAVNAGNVSPAWQMNGNAEFNVGAYVVGQFSESGTAKVTGPVITDTAVVAGTPDQTDVSNPPTGTPGAGNTTSTTTWSAIKGTWRQLGG